MSRNARTYTTEFKRDTIKYIEDHPELSVKEAAKHLGVPSDTIYGWLKADRRKSGIYVMHMILCLNILMHSITLGESIATVAIYHHSPTKTAIIISGMLQSNMLLNGQ